MPSSLPINARIGSTRIQGPTYNLQEANGRLRRDVWTAEPGLGPGGASGGQGEPGAAGRRGSTLSFGARDQPPATAGMRNPNHLSPTTKNAKYTETTESGGSLCPAMLALLVLAGGLLVPRRQLLDGPLKVPGQLRRALWRHAAGRRLADDEPIGPAICAEDSCARSVVAGMADFMTVFYSDECAAVWSQDDEEEEDDSEDADDECALFDLCHDVFTDLCKAFGGAEGTAEWFMGTDLYPPGMDESAYIGCMTPRRCTVT